MNPQYSKLTKQKRGLCMRGKSSAETLFKREIKLRIAKKMITLKRLKYDLLITKFELLFIKEHLSNRVSLDDKVSKLLDLKEKRD